MSVSIDSPISLIKVILVEDDVIDQLAFTRCVKQFALPYNYTIAGSLAEAKTLLESQAFDIAILDFHLGDGNALELLDRVKAKQIPFIVATGSGDEETAVRLMQRGAHDYLIKDPDRHYLTVLPVTVDRAIARKHAETQIRLLTYAMQNIRDGLYILDEENRLLFINQSLSEICNCPIEAAIGQPIQVLQQPDLSRFGTLEDACSKNTCSSDIEVEIVQPNGSSFPALLSESCLQEGEKRVRIGMLRNINHIKQVERDLRTAREELEQRVEERTIELKASKQRYATLAAAAPVGIFRSNHLGHCVYVNERWCQIAGLTLAEALGEGWSQSLHPEDLAAIAAEWEQSTQENRPFKLEYRFQRSDGSITWVFGQSIAERDADGQIVGYIGTITDISDRKRAELTLQKLIEGTATVTGEDFFPALVRHAAEALNVRYALISELVGDQLHTLGFWANGALQPAISYYPARTPCQTTLRDGEFHCESQVRDLFPADSDLLMLQAESYLGIALKDDFGRAIGNLCILDVQPLRESQRNEAIAILQVFAARAAAELQRKAANDALHRLNQDLEVGVEQRTIALQAREAQLRDLFDNATDLIQSIAPDGRILFVNLAWKATLGYTDADLEQLSIFQIIHPDDLEHCQIAMQRLFAGGPSLAVETRFLNKQGKEIVVEGNVNCHFQDGQPIATRGIFRDITHRKQTEAAINRQLAAMEAAIDGIAILQGGTYLYVNQAHLDLFGYKRPEELLGKSWMLLYPPEEVERLERDIFPVLERDRSWQGEAIAIRKNGSTFDEGLSLTLTEDGLLICVCRNMSERKRAELALRSSEKRYATLTSMAPVGIFRADAQGNCVYVNECWCEMTGLSPVEASGLGWIRALHPEDRKKYRDEWQRAIQIGDAFNLEYRFQKAQGQVIWVFGQAVQEREIDGTLAGYVATVTDISDRKRAEQVLRQQAEREALSREITLRIRQSLELQTIFDTACQEIRQFIQSDRVGIFKFDPESSCDDGEFVAESVVEGFPSVVAIKIQDHCFGERHAPLYMQGKIYALSDIHQGELLECHTSLLAKFQVQASLVMPLLTGGVLWGLLCIHQCSAPRQWQEIEINLAQQIANQLAIAIQQARLFEQLQQELTERQQAQKQLTESNRQLAISNEELARATRLKDEFLANMSHELRTPLNAILGMTEGLQEEVFGPINEEQKKALQTVERSGTHLLELINDILDLAKIEAGQVELHYTLTGIRQLCQSSILFVRQQALKKNLQLQVKVPDALPNLLIDERRIRQVLINLLNNAVKFTPEGGSILLEVSTELESDANAASSICFAVIDTGIGIAPEHLQKLFQPFIQVDSALNRQYSGTGLGLSLVKRIVELHGGHVDVSSEVGVGSRFTITLPCFQKTMQIASDSVPSTPFTPSRSETSTAAPLILLAEDNAANIATISSYLEAKGYRMIVANNGAEAIALTQSHQPNLILMDIQMPGMDGLEAMQQIRSLPHFSDLPIIALTALAMTGDQERCLTAGANDYLVKPIKLKQLAATIQQFLRG
ncbi:MAG: PAS domain S-box protein [Scytolyngbya sp. HA4215-MV1]|jgi:PAS domain S-box-containing protein|nr:PAS domain S-box protein [Scytolyngbya sp. HA4215-MV1]